MITYDFGDIVGVLVFAVLFLLLVVSIFLPAKLNRKADEAQKAILESEEDPTEKELHGQVVKKECFAESCGTLPPRMVKGFFLTIRTDDGDLKEYKVDEDIYHAVDENRIGTALIVGNRFYGFCPDEPSDEEDRPPKTE